MSPSCARARDFLHLAASSFFALMWETQRHDVTDSPTAWPQRYRFAFDNTTTVSFFGQLSQFSPRCRNILPDVTIFGWMSQFSAGCLIFPAVEN
ncbi:hypothetical protein V9T40_010569 [Parthenolecanium corni]|uniref:Uncharacterized protein n=1 Tax=Parthenolecanium corni TaxID=536013 RepID=A0AAN9T7M9_9HEMI